MTGDQTSGADNMQCEKSQQLYILSACSPLHRQEPLYLHKEHKHELSERLSGRTENLTVKFEAKCLASESIVIATGKVLPQ